MFSVKEGTKTYLYELMYSPPTTIATFCQTTSSTYSNIYSMLAK